MNGPPNTVSGFYAAGMVSTAVNQHYALLLRATRRE